MYAYRIAGWLFACLLTAAKSLQEQRWWDIGRVVVGDRATALILVGP
jgi:hypothetical protein